MFGPQRGRCGSSAPSPAGACSQTISFSSLGLGNRPSSCAVFLSAHACQRRRNSSQPVLKGATATSRGDSAAGSLRLQEIRPAISRLSGTNPRRRPIGIHFVRIHVSKDPRCKCGDALPLRETAPTQYSKSERRLMTKWTARTFFACHRLSSIAGGCFPTQSGICWPRSAGFHRAGFCGKNFK